MIGHTEKIYYFIGLSEDVDPVEIPQSAGSFSIQANHCSQLLAIKGDPFFQFQIQYDK